MEQIRTPFGGVLKLYPAGDGGNGETVVVCPGGGYSFLSPREAEPVVEVFRKQGYHGAVLEYCLEPEVLGTEPLKELAWSVRFLRSDASWAGNADRVWVIGFSAGGHLAASLGALWNEDKVFTANEQKRNRPDGVILGYPVISMKEDFHQRSMMRLTGGNRELRELFSLENRDLSKMPPVFLWNTLEDEKVPAMNSILFARKLALDGASCEYHLFHKGLHGMSLATVEVECAEENLHPDEHIAHWAGLCMEWMKEQSREKFVTGE